MEHAAKLSKNVIDNGMNLDEMKYNLRQKTPCVIEAIEHCIDK